MAAASMEGLPRIQLGDYIVIQRQKYTKLQKFAKLEATTVLGNDHLELGGLHEQLYNATFKMCPKQTTGGSGRRHGLQRLHTLELCSESELRNIRDVLGISASGEDNRNILDDGESQALRPEDIDQLRGECNESSKIIEKIVENSKTFHAKTEYSQEKYLKKKEKKYFEFVQIRRPTIRLITEIFHRQQPEKVLGLRQDTLSQLLSYAGVSAYGQYLMYESGTNGLLPACLLNAIGAGTEATLVHMHPGNEPQMQGLLALQPPAEQLKRCISVNLYSVLREYYQGEAASPEEANGAAKSDVVETEPCCKKPRLEEEEGAKSDNAPADKAEAPETPTVTSTDVTIDTTTTPLSSEAPTPTATPTATPKQKWQLENQRAVTFMRSQFDSLVVAAKEHPENIVKALLPFVKPSRPFVVYSQCRELLMELYVELKNGSQVTNMHLTSNWLRHYQILPNRTHPEVNMSGNSGYLLCGYTVSG